MYECVPEENGRLPVTQTYYFTFPFAGKAASHLMTK